MKFVLLIFSILLTQETFANNPRIQQLYLNKSTTQKIYLSPGLATSVKMPCEIDEVITPGSGILNHISERNKSRFSLEISNVARSTNFIVHCVDSTYVFDLIVNKKLHNDYIEIIGDYGVPRLTQFPYVKSDKISLVKFKPLDDTPKSILKEIESNRPEFDIKNIEKTKVFSSK
ncbi:MAG: hypothetical protein ACK41T_02270 [Pseudobdellovibrio sp.]